MLYIKLFIEREKNIGQSAPECPFKGRTNVSGSEIHRQHMYSPLAASACSGRSNNYGPVVSVYVTSQTTMMMTTMIMAKHDKAVLQVSTPHHITTHSD